MGDCYQLQGNRDGRADRDGDRAILDWVLGLDWIFFFVLLLYFPKQECCLPGLDSLSGMQTPLRGNGPRLWREFLWPDRRHRGEMLTRNQRMYNSAVRPR